MPHELKLSRRRVAGLILAAASTAAAAETPSGIDVLTRLFQAPSASADWFAPSFLAHIPIDQVNTVLATVKQQYGNFKSASGSGRDYIVHLDHGDVSAKLVLDTNGKIAGLLIRPKDAANLDRPIPGTLQDHIHAIASLPGKPALLVTTNGRPLASVNAETPLAVGSAFKLAVLKAVSDACDARRLAWNHTLRLDPSWRSLPSGILQNAAPGTEMTIEHLASLMISISDNTAADTLIATAGRAAIQAISPRNTPFLTTRELFILKADANAALRAKWAAADPTTRQTLLAAIDTQTLPAPQALTATPTLDVEWFLSALELQSLLEQVAHLPAFDRNPGLASRADWQRIAFKGGSDAGVLNLSTSLVAHDGTRHTVIATWNDNSALDETRLERPYAGILQRLATG